MDKTPKYLKMCKGAFKDIGIIDDGLSWVNPEKIQNLWARLGKDGKYYRITQATMPTNTIKATPQTKDWFQVYYQDQLQELVMCDYVAENCLCFLENFCEWFKVLSTLRKFISAEQLWLGYVMEKKYRKVWDGYKWK